MRGFALSQGTLVMGGWLVLYGAAHCFNSMPRCIRYDTVPDLVFVFLQSCLRVKKVLR